MAFLFTRSSNGRAAVPSASQTAASSEAPSPAASTAEPEPLPEPAPETSAAPEPSAAAGDEEVSVTFTCSPRCDRIEIDGEPVEKPTEPLKLKPGSYKVRLVKQGYLIHKERIEVEAGKPIEKTVRLIKIGPVKPRPSKNCGQFLCP
jgi:hypothetical protein